MNQPAATVPNDRPDADKDVEIERLRGELSYMTDEVVPALRAEIERLQKLVTDQCETLADRGDIEEARFYRGCLHRSWADMETEIGRLSLIKK